MIFEKYADADHGSLAVSVCAVKFSHVRRRLPTLNAFYTCVRTMPFETDSPGCSRISIRKS